MDMTQENFHYIVVGKYIPVKQTNWQIDQARQNLDKMAEEAKNRAINDLILWAGCKVLKWILNRFS